VQDLGDFGFEFVRFSGCGHGLNFLINELRDE